MARHCSSWIDGSARPPRPPVFFRRIVFRRFVDSAVARKIGDAWPSAAKTAILVVPSVVARIEFNVLVNPRKARSTGTKHATGLILMYGRATLALR
jgi:hypothetical protein